MRGKERERGGGVREGRKGREIKDVVGRFYSVPTGFELMTVQKLSASYTILLQTTTLCDGRRTAMRMDNVVGVREESRARNGEGRI